ncbi:DUF998 domain-containing protein [Lentzea aerocolonigenes]|uniref:DUF998 domain-containing protein n=1 Tax=Lentzea aerocolonigenes TaxID=68170 RepID=UPI000B0EDEF0|nr:DUF998 domain-containing protein [Lentzea aerocolonigenes]MCP2250654.1 Protein of unknown function (DUF998) [Lentzea aerocolonigenes]
MNSGVDRYVLIPRLAATGGSLAVVATVAMVGLLDLTVGPLRRTISEYALGDYRPVFDVAVLLLAAGSLAILVALVHKGLARWRSAGSIALVLWSVGLLLVVAFPKTNWAMGTNEVSGSIHRFGSMLAFVSLPVAIIALARPWLKDHVWGRHARWTMASGLLSVVAFMPVLYAIVMGVASDVRWWRVFPLGYIERILLIAEVGAVLVVGLWAIAASRVAPWRVGETSRTTSAPSTTSSTTTVRS